MPRLTKAERFGRYRDRQKIATTFREQEGYDALWKRMVDLYRGRHYAFMLDDEDRIAVNIAFGTINVIYPSISVNHPKITVTANKPEHDDMAVISEAVINYWWRHHNYHEPYRRAVKDFLVIGHGWLKIGWRYVEREEPLDPAGRQSMYGDQLQQLTMFADANPEMAGYLPSDQDVEANLPNTTNTVVEDRPFVERISPKDIFVNPEATCMDDLKWVCQRFHRPLEEVRTDKRYRESVRRSLKANATMGKEPERIRDSESRWKPTADDNDRVTLYECYDIDQGTMCVWAEGADDYLIEPRKMPYAFGHPFVMLRNYDVPDYFYPIGDLEQVECLQHELNKTRSQMMNHRKRYARKYLYHESTVGPEGRAALESDEDNTLVPIVNETIPLREAIVPLEQVAMPPEAYSYSELIESDIEAVSGVSEYARGAAPEIRRTATEAAIIQDAINARSADKLAIIERGISDVARRLLQIAQQFMTGPQMARVVGQAGEVVWVPFNRDDIQGEFDFAVEAGSTQPMNETGRRQQALAMMQALAPLVGPVVDPYAITRHVLQFGFGIKSPEKFLVPPGVGMMGMGAPGGEPGMQPPPMGGGYEEAPPEDSGVPDPTLNQLAAQVGLTVPNVS